VLTVAAGVVDVAAGVVVDDAVVFAVADCVPGVAAVFAVVVGVPVVAAVYAVVVGVVFDAADVFAVAAGMVGALGSASTSGHCKRSGHHEVVVPAVAVSGNVWGERMW
jgi:hypothetical protein